MSAENPFDDIRNMEARELERLTAYLEALDPDGWLEQSYCADWPVYSLVSHLSSHAVITRLRLEGWFKGAATPQREQFLEIWGFFDGLKPEQMLAEYKKATAEYRKVIEALPESCGLTEVEGFFGKRPGYLYLNNRLHEVVLHAWDTFVARDRHAVLDADAARMALLTEARIPVLDRQRAQKLSGKRVLFTLTDWSRPFVLDLTGEEPKLVQESATDADLSLELPAEEFYRFIWGRHFVPGVRPKLALRSGTAEDLAALKRAFR